MSEETKQKIKELEVEFNKKISNTFEVLMKEINTLKKEIRELKELIKN